MARMRYGVHKALEEEADAFVKQSLARETTHAGRSDILTPWKQMQRQRREVYTAAGVPEASLRQGMYHRRANAVSPHLNSRDGVAAPQRYGSQQPAFHSSLGDFVERMFDGTSGD